MKVADAKTAATPAKSNSPFFQKGVQQGLVSTADIEQPFFQKKSNDIPVIQAKLNIGQPNDKYEQEADAVADKVVQRLSNSDVAVDTGAEKNIQTKSFSSVPVITPLVQAKCDSCEQEEKLQKKENEEDADLAKEKLQKKPIFESNAVLPPDEENNVQRKCDTCEPEEEKVQKKELEEDSGLAKDKLEQKSIFESNTESMPGVELNVQRSNDNGNPVGGAAANDSPVNSFIPAPVITPFVQAKPAFGEHEESLQKKENEEDADLANEKLQKKPIFESNAVTPPDDENNVQLKCEACEHEEKNNVQTKLTVGEPNDKYEQEADAVADKAVQRLANNDTAVDNTTGNDVQTKPVIAAPVITPLVQTKCATCEHEEKLQKKEKEDETDPLGEAIQKKPVFETGIKPQVQKRCRECEEGNRVFLKPVNLLQLSGDASPSANGSRESVIAAAKSKIGKIEAKHDAGGGKRVGADHLLEIFHLAAPGVWDDSIIETAGAQMPSWCGIFSVWAHKKAGKNIGTWQMGKGVSAFNTLQQTTNPLPGDIGYIDQPYQHHCIVVKTEGNNVHTIDGNSGLFSEVKENIRTKEKFSGFFTAFGSGTAVQKKEEPGIQKSGGGGTEATASSTVESRLSSSKGSGNPLPDDVRTGMESSIGADFSNVNIHTGSDAVQLSKDLSAQAFTHGSDIYFNAGKYDTGSTQGQHLLAHELTHTVQQNGNVSRMQKTNNVVQNKDAIPVTPTDIPSLEKAAKDMYVWLSGADPGIHREQIFRTILLQKGFGKGLREQYKKLYKEDLDVVLSQRLYKKDAIRAKRYLDYGELRIVDKVYIASEGAGTDEDTLFRLMPMANKTRAKVEADFGNEPDYIADYSGTASLPNNESSRIAALLQDELSGSDLYKAKALYAFGELRPVDELKMAIEDKKVEDLYNALKSGMSSNADQRAAFSQLENDYQTAYGEELFSKLVLMYQHGVLSEKEKMKVWQIIGKGSALERIRSAVFGPGTDEEEIYDAIKTAVGNELAQLRLQFNDKNSELYELLNGDLNEEEMKRVGALLTENPTAQQQLQAAGAESGSAILDEIKMSSGDKFHNYKEAYNNKDGVFESYVSSRSDAAQKGATITVINGSPEEKIMKVGIGYFSDDEDYIFLVLKNFAANDPAKKVILNNGVLMQSMNNVLSSTDFNKVMDLLALENENIEDKVKRTREKIKRERSFLADFSNAGDAMDDEFRELTVALDRAKADGTLSPEEQEELKKMQQQTDQSIAVYIKVRDEIEESAATVLTTVTAVVIAIGTGGLGSGLSAALVAQQLAQAALISACARVIAMKVAKGDRFEIFGADGAGSFAAGAVDGMFNVFGGAAASKVVDKLFKEAVVVAAKKTGSQTFQSVGKKILTDAVEGGMSSGVGAAVETASKEDTWKAGFVSGIEEVVNKGATAAGGGIVVGGAISAGGSIIDKIKKNKVGDAIDPHAKEGKTDLAGDAAVLKIKAQVEANHLDDVLKNTARKHGNELTQLELNAEIEWALRKGKVEPSGVTGYSHEIDLGNGHKLRRNKNEMWCRFSPVPELCGLDGGVLNAKVNAKTGSKSTIKGKGKVSGKEWNDPTLTKAEMIADYRAVNPKSGLSDKQIGDKFDQNYRVNPETDDLIMLPKTVEGTPRAALPEPGTPLYNKWIDYLAGKGGEPCFPPSTIIKTPSGDRRIEELKIGEMVFAFDHIENRVVSRRVLKTFTNWTQSLVEIELEDHMIAATQNHAFWVETEQKYFRADELKPNWTVRLLDGNDAEIKRTTLNLVQSATHNFEVEEFHNYFVGNPGVLVHNEDADAANASKWADTTAKPSAIYVITDPDTGKVIYVGQTNQEVKTRLKQHLRDPKSSIFQYLQKNGYPQLAKNPDFLAGSEFSDLLDFTTPHPSGSTLTPFEISVWEQYYIDKYGFDSLENKINVITPDQMRAYAHMHNPCG